MKPSWQVQGSDRGKMTSVGSLRGGFLKVWSVFHLQQNDLECWFNRQIPGLHPRYTEAEFLGVWPGNLHFTSIVGDSDVDQQLRITTLESPPLLGLTAVGERQPGCSCHQFLSRRAGAGVLACTHVPGGPPGLSISREVREKKVLYMGCFLTRLPPFLQIHFGLYRSLFFS